MQNKRALLVGIDHYPGGLRQLKGCVADAKGMAEMLRRNSDGTKNYDLKLAVSGKDQESITRQNLREMLQELFGRARDLQVLFYFAGHGAESPWGSELVTQDYQQSHYGLSVSDVVTLANASAASEIVIIIDSCYAGDIGNIHGFGDAQTAADFRFGTAVLREGVTILAAARPGEGAGEEKGHGSFTRLLLEGLEGGAADNLGDVTALSLYEFASRAFNAFEQRPMLKSHVVQPSVLRTCQSFFTPELFTHILKYFRRADSRVLLSKKYEGERPIPPGTQPTPEQEALDYFKLLRNAGLLVTEDNIDLYFAAITGKHVLLTPRGQHLWRMADKDRL